MGIMLSMIKGLMSLGCILNSAVSFCHMIFLYLSSSFFFAGAQLDMPVSMPIWGAQVVGEMIWSHWHTPLFS